jgi:hypothetical protein
LLIEIRSLVPAKHDAEAQGVEELDSSTYMKKSPSTMLVSLASSADWSNEVLPSKEKLLDKRVGGPFLVVDASEIASSPLEQLSWLGDLLLAGRDATPFEVCGVHFKGSGYRTMCGFECL